MLLIFDKIDKIEHF